MADPFMEIRAMTLLEFGCPPLPIANGRRAETNEPVIINSHDLLSTFMAHAFKQQDPAINKRRKDQQRKIEDAYYRRLLLCDGTPSAIYSAMSEYTREYLSTYLKQPCSPNDIAVLSTDYVSPTLLNDIRSYHNALYMVATGTPPSPNTDATLGTLLKGCKLIHSTEKKFYAKAKENNPENPQQPSEEFTSHHEHGPSQPQNPHSSGAALASPHP